MLFDYPKTRTHIDVQNGKELPWYENTICPNLEFIAVPHALLLGSQSRPEELPTLSWEIKLRLVKQLLWPLKKYSHDSIEQQIHAYLQSESQWLRKDYTKRLRAFNRMSEDEFIDLLAYGAFELSRRATSVRSFKRSLRKQLPESSDKLMFSRLGRYILNGRVDEHWYRDLTKEITELFPEFDQKLIASLLSITSIRSSLPTNIAKFFKVLHQFFEEKNYTVETGKKGQKISKESMFKDVLDASLANLDLLKKGEPLIDSDKKNAPKIRRFAGAMVGVTEAVVVDIWIMRSFGCDNKRLYNDNFVSTSPTRSLYDAIEWYFQALGEYVNKEPRGVCSMAWSGIRSETNSATTRYSDILRGRLGHGIFEEQYGRLIAVLKKGIKFEER